MTDKILKKREFLNRSLSNPDIEREAQEKIGEHRNPLDILLEEEKEALIDRGEFHLLDE